MKIGLMRHFPVVRQFPTGWRNAAELAQWLREYNESPVTVGPADTGKIAWRRCISSDMQRAHTTARTVYSGLIETTPLLREPDFAEFRTGTLRLPVRVWKWILQIAWASGHRSQRACRDHFRKRVEAIADRLDSESEDTLVVSHAAMMLYLGAELRKRGFGGPNPGIAKHATLYLYERNDFHKAGPR